MRISSLTAEAVHGYLSFDIRFRDDFTFLTGLNGCGKTTALRLLMGLLTPDIRTLSGIALRHAQVTVAGGDGDVVIRVQREPVSTDLVLSITGVDDPLVVAPPEQQLLLDFRGASERENEPVLERMREHPVYLAIARVSTPMFLGLDRRIVVDEPADEVDFRRRHVAMRINRYSSRYEGVVARGLLDINELVQFTMNEIRAQQERLDNDLRNKLLVQAFQYRHSRFEKLDLPPPEAFEELPRKRTAAEHAISNLRLPVVEVKEALDHFFDQMDALATQLRRGRPAASRRADSDAAKSAQQLFEWQVNRSQFERINHHLDLLAEYSVKRAALHGQVDRYLGLVNSFLGQTGKSIEISERGTLRVLLHGAQSESLWALSSGERQLAVMLGHLALNSRLLRSGVFIVDEPELSLHISWQERFVDAIRAANPGVQLIMATHSPAIIMDRDEHCEDLGSLGTMR